MDCFLAKKTTPNTSFNQLLDALHKVCDMAPRPPLRKPYIKRLRISPLSSFPSPLLLTPRFLARTEAIRCLEADVDPSILNPHPSSLPPGGPPSPSTLPPFARIRNLLTVNQNTYFFHNNLAPMAMVNLRRRLDTIDLLDPPLPLPCFPSKAIFLPDPPMKLASSSPVDSLLCSPNRPPRNSGSCFLPVKLAWCYTAILPAWEFDLHFCARPVGHTGNLPLP